MGTPSVDISASPTLQVNSFPTRNPTKSPSILNELPTSSPTIWKFTTSSTLTSIEDSTSTTLSSTQDAFFTTENAPNEYYLSEAGRCMKTSEFISTKEECALAASILNLP